MPPRAPNNPNTTPFTSHRAITAARLFTPYVHTGNLARSHVHTRCCARPCCASYQGMPKCLATSAEGAWQTEHLSMTRTFRQILGQIAPSPLDVGTPRAHTPVRPPPLAITVTELTTTTPSAPAPSYTRLIHRYRHRSRSGTGGGGPLPFD